MNSVSEIFPQLSIPPQALHAYEQGNHAEEQHQYQTAIQHYGNALVYREASPVFLSRVYDKRGSCYWFLGQYDQAARDFQQALEISDDPGQRARCRARLGEVADARGWYDEALQLYQTALQEGLNAHDLLAMGWAQRGMGIVYRRQGNAEKAIFHLTQALTAFQQMGNTREQARVLTSLGRTRYTRGEYHLAIAAHTRALQILHTLHDKWRLALCLNDLGECYQALFALDEAVDYHEQALKMVLQENAEVIEPDVKRNMGNCLVLLGRTEEGIAYLGQALAMAERLGNHEQTALALYALTQAYLRQGEIDTAVYHSNRLTALAHQLHADRYLALAAFRRGQLAIAQGNKQQAASELQTAMLAAQTALDQGLLWQLHATLAQVVPDAAIAAVHRTIAADFIQQAVYPLTDDKIKAQFLAAEPVAAILQSAGIDARKL
jgi:tetratricopeptide (TPR) repeat protein